MCDIIMDYIRPRGVGRRGKMKIPRRSPSLPLNGLLMIAAHTHLTKKIRRELRTVGRRHYC